MAATTETIPARVDSRFRGGMSATDQVDVRGLRRRLEETVQGEVRFDAASKALYATDASNYRQVPIGVVILKTLDDILATHRACHEFGAPILNRGGGTSLSGETVNFAVVIDNSKYLTEIGDADAQTQTVICQPCASSSGSGIRSGMNPGKVVDPYRLDEHLKLGTEYNPWRPPVRFAYQLDKGDFAHHTLRCVGIGKCRVPDASSVMCPSYMVTREEKHTTRGRARLLFEMLEGEVITDGWQSEEVYDALDLCLACTGCTSDCPVQVDMPTMKAEFLHHHFKSLRRWRPRYAYAFGLIDQAARVASRVPEVANFFTQTPGLSRLAKFAAGMAPEREIPEFAPITLQQWWRQRGGTANPSGRRIVLWPDTFNNYFHTDVGVACVEAIEAAGWQVVIPSGHVCCGRPLYDSGFLDLAERYLRRVLDVLREEIRQGTPVVGMEPSCLAVFKDELSGMLPHDDDAQRLARCAMHFSEFFEKFDIPVPRLEREAIVWGHCHHKATGGVDGEQQLLERMGLSVEPVSGGCCGLAGSWGFEEGHHEISMQCGEQALLPAVREATPDALVIADGFSCKTQIEQGGTGRRALHVAQAMKMAREHGPQGYRGGRPEDRTTSGVRRRGHAIEPRGLPRSARWRWPLAHPPPACSRVADFAPVRPPGSGRHPERLVDRHGPSLRPVQAATPSASSTDTHGTPTASATGG